MGEATPIFAMVLVLAVVGFISWFWLNQDAGLLILVPLYVAAAIFCFDMMLLRKRLHNSKKDIY